MIFALLAFAFSPASISLSSYINSGNSEKVEFFRPVIKKLLDQDVDSNFIYDLVNDTKSEFNDKYVIIPVITILVQLKKQKPSFNLT